MSTTADTVAANLALSHLGVGKNISNLETERSDEAAACRQFFDQVVEESQRDYPYSFNTVIEDLVLVETNPNDEWSYSYRYPADCERFSRILSGTRNDADDSRVPYRIVKDATGQVILTDTQAAQAEYHVLVDDPTKWPSDYTMAVSLLLAFYIAPRVTGGDPFKMGDRAGRAYMASIGKARSNNENEQQNENPPDGEFVRARN